MPVPQQGLMGRGQKANHEIGHQDDLKPGEGSTYYTAPKGCLGG
jgi:hypothetical protein